MKRNIISLWLLLVGAGAAAQQNQPKAVGYIRGEIIYYKVANCQPSGPVEVYSQANGGHLITATVADDGGYAQVEVPLNERAILLISRKEAAAEGVQGIGYTTLLPKPEMELRSFNVEAGSTNRLKWEVISHQPGTNFEVYRTNANGAFEKIAALKAGQQSGNIFTYTDATAPATDGMVYEVRVINASGKLNLTMGGQQMNTAKKANIKLFPTVCTSQFTVQLSAGTSGVVQIFSTAGVLVQSSQVQAGTNNINVTKLSAASYMVKVIARDNQVLYHGRIAKQ